MADWMKGTINVQRPINTLTLVEMECMASNVIGKWILLTMTRPPETPKAISALKMLGVC